MWTGVLSGDPCFMRVPKVCAMEGRQWLAVGDAAAASSSDSTERASSRPECSG